MRVLLFLRDLLVFGVLFLAGCVLILILRALVLGTAIGLAS